jgi:hypothetical protein
MKIVDGYTSTNVDVAVYAEKMLLKMTNYSMNTIQVPCH